MEKYSIGAHNRQRHTFSGIKCRILILFTTYTSFNRVLHSELISNRIEKSLWMKKEVNFLLKMNIVLLLLPYCLVYTDFHSFGNVLILLISSILCTKVYVRISAAENGTSGHAVASAYTWIWICVRKQTWTWSWTPAKIRT